MNNALPPIFTYEQWDEKFGDLQHTNRPLNSVYAGTEYFEQSKQLSECNLTLEQLESYIRWWRGLNHNHFARNFPSSGLTIDPYFEDAKNKPVFISAESVVPKKTREQLEAELAEIRKTYPNARLTPFGIIKGAPGLKSVEDRLSEIERRIEEIVSFIRQLTEV